MGHDKPIDKRAHKRKHYAMRVSFLSFSIERTESRWRDCDEIVRCNERGRDREWVRERQEVCREWRDEEWRGMEERKTRNPWDLVREKIKYNLLNKWTWRRARSEEEEHGREKKRVDRKTKEIHFLPPSPFSHSFGHFAFSLSSSFFSYFLLDSLVSLFSLSFIWEGWKKREKEMGKKMYFADSISLRFLHFYCIGFSLLSSKRKKGDILTLRERWRGRGRVFIFLFLTIA